MITLRGLTWDHPRGYQGLLAATETFARANPEIRIHWDKHSLGHFEAHPIADLAARFDLIVLDHPFVGEAWRQACLVDCGDHAEVLDLPDLAADAVGQSFASYQYAGGLWALPIDAACQVAAFRPDLLGATGIEVPQALQDARALGERRQLTIGLGGVHALMTFFTICANLGQPAFGRARTEVVDDATGLAALEQLRVILGWCPADVLGWNSIAALEALASRADLVYCPYVFGYSTYGQRSGHRRPLAFAGIPGVEGRRVNGSVLGGTGLAISRRCVHVDAALRFAAHVTSRAVQREMALQGGQPARRSAWLDDAVNAACNDFYRHTRETIESAWLRPRYPGYVGFQTEGGRLLESYLRSPEDARGCIARLNALHRRAFDGASPL